MNRVILGTARARYQGLTQIRGLAKKAGGFKAGGKGKAPGGGRKGEGGEGKGALESLNRFVEMAEEAKAFKPDFTEEELQEHERIAKEYQRQSFRRHNALEKDVSNKIWLQQEALRAMPHDLYEEAIKIDDTPPPANRPWPFFDTPPIEDFNIKDYIKSGDGEDDDEEEEARV
jgi:hypothetical protein